MTVTLVETRKRAASGLPANSNRDTQTIRNRRNHPRINHLTFSNRDRMAPPAEPISRANIGLRGDLVRALNPPPSRARQKCSPISTPI
jgi:hypothetical protein